MGSHGYITVERSQSSHGLSYSGLPLWLKSLKICSQESLRFHSNPSGARWIGVKSQGQKYGKVSNPICSTLFIYCMSMYDVVQGTIARTYKNMKINCFHILPFPGLIILNRLH